MVGNTIPDIGSVTVGGCSNTTSEANDGVGADVRGGSGDRARSLRIRSVRAAPSLRRDRILIAVAHPNTTMRTERAGAPARPTSTATITVATSWPTVVRIGIPPEGSLDPGTDRT